MISRVGIPVLVTAIVLVPLAFAAGPGVAHADTGGQMYGDPQAAAPYWRYQRRQEDCGLMAVADVIGQVTGKEPPNIAVVIGGLITPSSDHRGAVYHFDGTTNADDVMMLQKAGIKSGLTDGNTMPALEQDLAGGHKVIAFVNAETLWNYPMNQGQHTNPDHAVVVIGVDTGSNIVHLNDSGQPKGRDEQIPMATFTQAWATSNDQLIVTQ